MKFKFTKGELEKHLSSIEREYFLNALDYFRWNYELAAFKLGISRSRLYAKSKEFHFEKLSKFKVRDK